MSIMEIALLAFFVLMSLPKILPYVVAIFAKGNPVAAVAVTGIESAASAVATEVPHWVGIVTQLIETHHAERSAAIPTAVSTPPLSGDELKALVRSEVAKMFLPPTPQTAPIPVATASIS